MSVQACAELVERGDPDRFLAAMAAPPAARAPLFALYALNLEAARAPWMTAEPMIAEMRLQYWRDALEGMGQGRSGDHEIAPAVMAAIRAGAPLAALDDMVAARRHDIARSAFTPEMLSDYLDATAGALMWATAAALGAGPTVEAQARAVGRAQGLANWLLARPDLEARGWAVQTPDLQELIAEALDGLRDARGVEFGPGLPAIRAAWRAKGVLGRAARDPSAIAEGRLGEAEFMRRGSLLLRALTGRW